MKWPFSWPKKYVIGREGNPYLSRWDIFGTKHTNWPHLYLHQFHRSDSDAADHGHPWFYLSVILKTGYWEFREGKFPKWIKPLSIIFRPKTWTHRIVLEEGTEGEVWTLVLTGPKVQEWGFNCKSGWTHWKKVTEREDQGLPGCEE